MITGIGLVNQDNIAVVPSVVPGEKTAATQFLRQVGGPVPVALQTIARLGYAGAVCLVATTGGDETGRVLRKTLRQSGVDTALCPTGGKTCAASVSLVLVDEGDGSRTVANYAADLPPLNLSGLPAQKEILAHTRLLHLDGRDLPANLLAAHIVRENGGTVSLDLGTMRPGREALLPLCNLIWASQKGGEGAFPAYAGDPAKQVRGFLDYGAQIAGVTLGANGVVLGGRDGGNPVHLPAFDVETVRDTCGAGDVFHGAFLWAHLAAHSPMEAAQFAQAAAALRVQVLGNEAGIPTREAVEAFLQRVLK